MMDFDHISGTAEFMYSLFIKLTQLIQEKHGPYKICCSAAEIPTSGLELSESAAGSGNPFVFVVFSNI
jgi:hypothetical protein